MAGELLGVAWGGLVLLGAQRVVRWFAARARARALQPPAPTGASRAGSMRARAAEGFDRLGPVARVARGVGRARRRRARDGQLAAALPATVDLLAVAVSAGATPFTAIEIASAWAPDVVRIVLDGVLGACRLGASFESALRRCGQRDVRLRPLTDVLATSARLGAPLDAALARLAAESRRDLRRRAEARARTVPVRLLFPLVFLVLPAFGLLTVVPAVVAGFHGI